MVRDRRVAPLYTRFERACCGQRLEAPARRVAIAPAPVAEHSIPLRQAVGPADSGMKRSCHGGVFGGEDQVAGGTGVMTPVGRQGMRRWRSRAFVQPLLVTVVGVVLSVMLYLAVIWSPNGPSDGPCTYGSEACGYAFMGRMGQAFELLPVLLIGLLITGLVVGLSSRDPRLAFRAVLVGTLLATLGAGAALIVPGALGEGRDVPFRIVSSLAGAAFLGLVLLIPVVLGLVVGRAVRPSPKHRSDATDPE
jgi:hypothetical protein